MVLSTSGRNYPKPHLLGGDGREHGRIGVDVVQEAGEERGREVELSSKKAGSGRNYAILNISQSKKGLREPVSRQTPSLTRTLGAANKKQPKQVPVQLKLANLRRHRRVPRIS